ncbi:MAG: cell division protein ZapA [Gammaproteobacteria bacterium]|nr:cell division protein ZapA [Gammaproteobacteria bacterium]MCP5136988.1 cell division protein ZapA [Gammaproteobacteria bacterium]
MTRSNNTVKVHILGKEYQIACPLEERDAVLASARRLDERMQELRDSRAVLGLERIAVMAALSLTNELLQQEMRADALARSIQARVDSLHRLMDGVIEEN